MSNAIKHVEENIDELQNEWNDCLNTIYGSLIASVNLLKGEEGLTDFELLARLKKAELPFIEDPDFMKKTVESVGFNYEEDCKNKPLCVWTSTYNTIILPYIWSDENEEPIPVPVRRDAMLQRTAKTGEWKIVDWEEKNE